MLTKEQRDEILRIASRIEHASTEESEAYELANFHKYLDSITVPEGWQVVPVEPTREMLLATSWPSCAATDYRHMLAAAPKLGQRQQRIHPAGMGGTQRLYRFPNEYGASVVQSPFSYGGGEGLFELAVTAYFGEGMDDFELTYSTPITNYVIGYLTEEEVQSTLDQIRALPQERT